MVARKKCASEDCEKPSYSLGFCIAHYWRFKQHGSPEGGKTAKGAPLKFLTKVVAEYSSDDCLIYPFYTNPKGYTVLLWRGAKYGAHVITCTMAHGEKPSPRHQVAHACGKPSCVNPKHLRWATSAENLSDRWGHGTMPVGERHRRAKLTDAECIAIRTAPPEVTSRELATKYRVHVETIRRVRSGKARARHI